MSDILKAARCTFGVLLVLTAWSFAMAEYVDMRWKLNARIAEEQQSEYDKALLEFGPGADAREQRRYEELMSKGN